MAGKNAVGCAGWGFAGFLLLALIGQCSKGTPTPSTAPQGLASIPATEMASKWLFVAPPTLNCRAEGSASAASVRKFSASDAVGVIEESGGWSRVSGSPTCWVKSSYLSETRRVISPGRQAAPQRAYSSSAASRSSSSGSSSSTPRRSTRQGGYAGTCPCSGSNVCIGPRGGRFCITSGGNKRYGV